MIKRAIGVALSAIVLASTSAGAAKASPADPLEGVWQIANVVTTGAHATTTNSPQSSVVIFTRGYYTYVSGGIKPRTASASPKDPDKLTDAEKLAKFEEWEGVTGQAGTFDVKGTILTRHPIVAKNVAVMTTNGPIAEEFKLTGNSLVLVSKSTAGQPVSETRTTLTRVR